MSGFFDQYDRTLLLLVAFYSVGLLVVTWLPFGSQASGRWKMLWKRLSILNFFGAFLAVNSNAIAYLSFSRGDYEFFESAIWVIRHNLFAGDLGSIETVLFFLNGAIFVPAAFFGVLGGWRIKNILGAVVATVFSMEISQFLIFSGTASLSDLVLNVISGFVGVSLGKTATRKFDNRVEVMS